MRAVRPVHALRNGMRACCASSCLPCCPSVTRILRGLIWNTIPLGRTSGSACPRGRIWSTIWTSARRMRKILVRSRPTCCCTARPGWARPFCRPALPKRSRRAAFPSRMTPRSTLLQRMRRSNSGVEMARRPLNALRAMSAPICSSSTIWVPRWVLRSPCPRFITSSITG